MLGFHRKEMKFVSPLLKHVVYPGLARTGYLSRNAGVGPVVVTYHGILSEEYQIINFVLDGNFVSADSFRRQLRLLKDRYNVISPEQFLLWCQSKQPLPPRSLLLTCDDGLQNVLTDMVPILQEFGFSCLFFITGASLEDIPSMLWYDELYLMMVAAPETLTWDFPQLGIHVCATGRQEKHSLWWSLVQKLSQFDSANRRKTLDQMRADWGLPEHWDAVYRDHPVLRSRFFTLGLAELRQLSAFGMSIGAHTFSHPMLSQLPSELAWSEISEPRHTLEKALGQPIWAMAYPFGDPASVGQREMEMAERAGYSCAFINQEGSLDMVNGRFALPRVHVTGEMHLGEFEAHVSGFYQRLRHYLGA